MLVTGASGFVGSRLLSTLAQDGLRVVGLASQGPEGAGRYVFRLPDARLGRLLEREQPEAIVHCAGSSTVAGSFLEPGRDFEANVLSTRAVLEAAAACARPPAVLLLSSAAVYGEGPPGPIDEGRPERPVSPYGFHKLLAEALCREYQLLFAVPTLILRVFSLYGPGLRKQLWWDVVRQWYAHGHVRLGGGGHETRDWLHVDDFARVVAHLLRHARPDGRVLNVAGGQACSVAALVRQLLAALGQAGEVEFSGVPRPGDPPHLEADVSRARALGVPAGRALGSGIEEYAQWARESVAGRGTTCA